MAICHSEPPLLAFALTEPTFGKKAVGVKNLDLDVIDSSVHSERLYEMLYLVVY